MTRADMLKRPLLIATQCDEWSGASRVGNCQMIELGQFHYQKTLMKMTLPKRKPALKQIFTDIDGTKYFEDSKGDIVRANGELVTLTEEEVIRAILKRH